MFNVSHVKNSFLCFFFFATQCLKLLKFEVNILVCQNFKWDTHGEGPGIGVWVNTRRIAPYLRGVDCSRGWLLPHVYKLVVRGNNLVWSSLKGVLLPGSCPPGHLGQPMTCCRDQRMRPIMLRVPLYHHSGWQMENLDDLPRALAPGSSE